MQKITFITAVIRPLNLLKLQLSVQQCLGNKVAWNWIVIVDGKAVPSLNSIPALQAHVIFAQIPHLSYGFLEKNKALDLIEENTWIHFLDDDTELHPSFLGLFEDTLHQHPNVQGMVFGQTMPDGVLRAPDPGLSTYIGKVDQGQYIVKRSVIGYHRFFAAFGADGEFFNRIYGGCPDRWIFRKEVGFHHNNLRAGEPWTPETGYGKPY